MMKKSIFIPDVKKALSIFTELPESNTCKERHQMN